MQKLHIQRLVKTQLFTHQLNDRGIRFGPGNQTRRIARQHMDKQKHQHRHNQQRRDKPQQAFTNIVQHGRYFKSASSKLKPVSGMM